MAWKFVMKIIFRPIKAKMNGESRESMEANDELGDIVEPLLRIVPLLNEKAWNFLAT